MKKRPLTYEKFVAEGIKLPSPLAENLLGWDIGYFGAYAIIYPGMVYIEYEPHAVDIDKKYSTVIGRCDFYGHEESEVARYVYLYYLEEICYGDDWDRTGVEELILKHRECYKIPESWYW